VAAVVEAAVAVEAAAAAVVARPMQRTSVAFPA
jgi:hypothetical protein